MTDIEKQILVSKCRSLMSAYDDGLLGDIELPEDNTPMRLEGEDRLVYFTLPMSLNYRRSSTQLWSAASKTYLDDNLKAVYDLAFVAGMDEGQLRANLVNKSLAMQPLRHTRNWHTIACTIFENWGSVGGLLAAVQYDYVALKECLQKTHKKGFPYLSGPKLFNYWCFILTERCDVKLKNSDLIDIAVDVHVRRASAELGLITDKTADELDAIHVAQAWRDTLRGSTITPTMLNVPLWAWSRSGFLFKPTIE